MNMLIVTGTIFVMSTRMFPQSVRIDVVRLDGSLIGEKFELVILVRKSKIISRHDCQKRKAVFVVRTYVLGLSEIAGDRWLPLRGMKLCS